ncbi:hypothetical protein KHQ81_04030 [Mycoplasmatota bacterium]|nr:hypothetical protein KHQ81_04030 [Mycoplasmatota bacterium]
MQIRLNRIIILVIVLVGLLGCTKDEKIEVKLNSSEEAIQKFENKDSFIIVIGESLCGGCQEYKEGTITKYVNKHTQDDLIYIYSDKSFANTTEFYNFLTTYEIDYNSSPTTYFIKNGEYIKTNENSDVQTKSEDIMTLKQLEEFISKNEASE